MIIYTGIYIIALLGLFFGANRSKVTKRRYLFCVFGLLILFAALRSSNVGIDLRVYYSSYYPKFATAKWSELRNVTASGHWEWGYCALCKILAMMNPEPQFLIGVTSIISILPYAYFIYRNSDDVVFPTVFYIGMHVYTMSMNILRQAVATGFAILAFEKLKRKQYVRFIIYAVIATSIHTAAVLIFALLILERINFKRRAAILLAGATVIVSFSYQYIITAFMNLPIFGEEYSIYELGVGHAAGYITYHTLGLFTISALILVASIFGYVDNKKDVEIDRWNRFHFSDGKLYLQKNSVEEIEWSNNTLIYSSYLVVLFRFCAFLVNALARAAYYFMPLMMITYPKMRPNINTRLSQKSWDLIIYTAITVFFIYICVFRAQDLWGVVPYEFFWNA
ncbi:MAG: EpsG family protein [Lachnospiraceae bacterium]|nr:EpsG family protein [Lachnospiraceae bacterium]